MLQALSLSKLRRGGRAILEVSLVICVEVLATATWSSPAKIHPEVGGPSLAGESGIQGASQLRLLGTSRGVVFQLLGAILFDSDRFSELFVLLYAHVVRRLRSILMYGRSKEIVGAKALPQTWFRDLCKAAFDEAFTFLIYVFLPIFGPSFRFGVRTLNHDLEG